MTSLTEDLKTFLNTTITSEKDLTPENLFRLLDSQQREQTQLDTKLSTVTAATKETLKAALESSTAQQNELTRLDTCFQNTQTHLASFSQDDAFLNNLKETEGKLKILDRAKNYIKALLVASELSSQALDLVQSQPEKAAIPYQQLVKFEQFITQQQDAPQELSVHLAKCKTRLWEDLDVVLTKDFKETLEALSWPQPMRPPYGPQLGPKLKAFEKAFHNLLMLQDPDPACILNPISLLLQGLSLRFRFHFETSKPTNRLDKPEWYLQHCKNTITSHLPFLMTTIQPILDGMNLNISAKDQFIKGLLQDVERKLTRSMPALLQQPNLLAHTMHEVLEFDKTLQDDFSYPIMGLSGTILENKEWFDTWFYAEKKFAQTRYDEIMLDRQAFDMEDKDESSFDRTKSSTRLIHLLESITEAYQLVPNLSQRFMFFAEIQLDLLGQYHKRLALAVDSFEALSLIRSVPVPGALPDAVTGVMTASETGGTSSALYRLYRWWTSGRSIYDVLQDWNEDEMFLGIQYEISQSPESIQLMDSTTQERNNMLRLSRLHESDQNGLFADAITAYDQLCLRMEKIFVKLPVKEWITNARAYSKKDIWWQPDSNASEMTDDLYRPLQDFRLAFQLMKKCLPETYFIAILRKTLLEVEDWYWRHIITQNQFSSAGALQLQTDLNLGLWKLCKKWVLKPENYMKRLKEAIHLLNVSFNSGDTPLSCDQLMKALSDTSQLETVQKTLAKLDIEVLSNGEIRDVLRRRNDMLNSWS